jgi:hypothetical protein
MASPHAGLTHRTWTFHYGKGSTSFSIGTALSNTVIIPAADPLVSPMHAMLYATYGYFWLLDNNTLFGTYYELFTSAKPVKLTLATPPVHMLLGDNSSLLQATMCVV